MLKFSRGFSPRFSRGFTLIELMIGVALMAILISMAVPNFSLWIRNMGIRTAAESILSGLQLARAEALTGNTIVRFQLTSALDSSCALSPQGPHWVVSRGNAEGGCDAAPSDEDDIVIVQSHDGNQAGGNKTQIEAASQQGSFTFNGLGRFTSSGGAVINVYGADGNGDCVVGGGKTRCLRIEVNPNGGIRMCDPALIAPDTQACGGTS
jgi:type IV fimbrial biogenesis protein FimT